MISGNCGLQIFVLIVITNCWNIHTVSVRIKVCRWSWGGRLLWQKWRWMIRWSETLVNLCHFLTTSCTFNLHVSHGFQGGRHLVVCYATEMGTDAVWQKCIGLCNMRVRTWWMMMNRHFWGPLPAGIVFLTFLMCIAHNTVKLCRSTAAKNGNHF